MRRHGGQGNFISPQLEHSSVGYTVSTFLQRYIQVPLRNGSNDYILSKKYGQLFRRFSRCVCSKYAPGTRNSSAKLIYQLYKRPGTSYTSPGIA